MTDQDKIAVQDIARLDVKPGDTLVVTVDRRSMTPAHLEALRRGLADNLPDGVKTLILDGSVSLSIVPEPPQFIDRRPDWLARLWNAIKESARR